MEIYKIFNMYAAYGYFLEGNYQQAQKDIERQLEKGLDCYYESSLKYNLQLCKGILFVQRKQ